LLLPLGHATNLFPIDPFAARRYAGICTFVLPLLPANVMASFPSPLGAIRLIHMPTWSQ